DDLDAILEQTPNTKRTFLFSATMPKEVARIATNYMNEPTEITVGKQNAGAENVKHIFYQVHAHDRYLALKRIADYNPDIYGIVFCRTRAETKDVADKLIKDGYNADALHGDLSQAQRDHVMKRFRDKSLQMLVATDVAARGIDVKNITHVINYNLPDELEVYTHRSGRTGRADKSGISISIVNYREKSKVPQIERIIQKRFEKSPIPSGGEICKKQLFNLIDKMENVEVDEAQIAPFMDTVNKKLEWLSKEQIIKHFVSLEFNRFLEYYKGAKDLNDNTPSPGGKRKNKKETSNSRGQRTGQRGKDKFTRIFISIGRKDNVQPKNIIGIVNDNTQDRDINFGAIDIKDSFSFFEVGEKHAYKVINSFMGNKTFGGRQLRVELASEIDSIKNIKNRKKKHSKS
ncbi:DEAD/DEAH box helicase, partial [Bacteroidota bacterium]